MRRNNVVCATSKGSDQRLSDQNICLMLDYSMTFKLLITHYLEFLSLIGGCTGSSESTLVKMKHCWKSHVAAQIEVGRFQGFTVNFLGYLPFCRPKNTQSLVMPLSSSVLFTELSGSFRSMTTFS